MTKQEEVWALIEEYGEEKAIEMQRKQDDEKAVEQDKWLKSELIG